MSYSLNFDRKLTACLNKFYRKNKTYRWVAGQSLDKRSKVDVVGFRNEKPKVLIEVELKKDNPVENVVKIWRWAFLVNPRQRILLIQAFSAHYLNSSKPGATPPKTKQFQRAKFIGEQMQKSIGITYKALPIHTTTRDGKLKQFSPRMRHGTTVKEGGGAMLRAAEELAKEVRKLLQDAPYPL